MDDVKVKDMGLAEIGRKELDPAAMGCITRRSLASGWLRGALRLGTARRRGTLGAAARCC
jgi:hypothetical protein